MDAQERRRLDEQLRRSTEDARRDAIRRERARSQILGLQRNAIRTVTERRKLEESVPAKHGADGKGGAGKLTIAGVAFGALAAILFKKR